MDVAHELRHVVAMKVGRPERGLSYHPPAVSDDGWGMGYWVTRPGNNIEIHKIRFSDILIFGVFDCGRLMDNGCMMNDNACFEAERFPTRQEENTQAIRHTSARRSVSDLGVTMVRTAKTLNNITLNPKSGDHLTWAARWQSRPDP